MGLFKKSRGRERSSGLGEGVDGLGLDRGQLARLGSFHRQVGALDDTADLRDAMFALDSSADPRDERFLVQLGAICLVPLNMSVTGILSSGLGDLLITPEDDFDDPRGVATRAREALRSIVQDRLDAAGSAPGTLDYSAVIEEAVSLVSPDGFSGPDSHIPALRRIGTPAALSVWQRYMFMKAADLAGRVDIFDPLPADLVDRIRRVIGDRDSSELLNVEARRLTGHWTGSYEGIASPFWQR